MKRKIKIRGSISRRHLIAERVKAGEYPPVKFRQILKRHIIRSGIKRTATATLVLEIAKHKPRGIADFAIYFRHLLDNVVRHPNIGMIVERCHPQAQNVRSVLLYHLLGQYGVAKGLGHFLSLAVHNPAVGADSFVRRMSVHRHRREKRRLKPPAKLVCTLKVQLCGNRKPLPLVQNGGMGTPAVEPHIKNIVFFGKLTAPALADHIVAKKFRRLFFIPSVRAFGAEQS
ncbi:hypothetical protein FACS1894120_2990 [Clostridia bacterium]|nr:hypothetical protein FACS1894120_2990 [Clostridia bacterium]